MRCASPQKTTKKHQNSSGNAVVIILVIIALVAALTAVAMRSSGRTSSNSDQEQARIQASKIIKTAKSLEAGVQKLLIANRCSENEISFENTITSISYTNSNAPTDYHCHIFHVNGAAETYTPPDTSMLDTTKSAKFGYGQWLYTGTRCILGVGSDDNNNCSNEEIALIAALPHISLEICRQINIMNGITNPASDAPGENFGNTVPAFQGTFTAASSAEIGDSTNGTALVGHPTGCAQIESGALLGSYIFYNVLYAR